MNAPMAPPKATNNRSHFSEILFCLLIAKPLSKAIIKNANTFKAKKV